MINYRQEIYNKLKTILPTYPELFVKEVQMPCITYRLNNNADLAMADKYGFSELSYIIKLWGNSYDQLSSYEAAVDDAMRELGFTRNSANELNYNDQIQLIFIYDAVGYEENKE